MSKEDMVKEAVEEARDKSCRSRGHGRRNCEGFRRG